MKATPTAFGGLGFRNAVETAFQGLIGISEGCYQYEGLARTACSEGQGGLGAHCVLRPLPLVIPYIYGSFRTLGVPFGALIIRVLLFEVLY